MISKLSPFAATIEIGAPVPAVWLGIDVAVGCGDDAAVAVGSGAVVPSCTGAPSLGSVFEASALFRSGTIPMLCAPDPLRPDGVAWRTVGVVGALRRPEDVTRRADGDGGGSRRVNCRMR